MRVACLIDSLGQGGAQRQLALLAVLLQRQGCDVTVITYHPYDFFRGMIEQAGVAYRCVAARSTAHRAVALRRELRAGGYDVVLAFLDASCLYAELASLPRRDWGLVVSERLAAPAPGWHDRLRRQLHLLADYVTTNSHTNRLLVERAVPQLAGRIITVYNAVDLERFRPAPVPQPRPAATVQLVVAATYQHKKNLAGLIEAIAIVRRRAADLDVTVDWYGEERGGPNAGVRDFGLALIAKKGLAGCVRLHPASDCIEAVYQQADAVVLPSLFEGLPNVVCEAMACGRPVLVSAVCDAGNLVRGGWNGFLFDPTSPDDIAKAIIRFGSLSRPEQAVLGKRGRCVAEHMFDPERFASHYALILRAAAQRTCIDATHWPPEIPATAHQYVSL